MRVVDIIEKKRDGFSLEKEEIKFLLSGYAQGNVPDYQMSAFLMAAYIKGINMEELMYITKEMIDSGETIPHTTGHFLLDKHSTGGVGDKTSIALAPLLASFGISTCKLSGKGLGHTGGTIDKLESIQGFRFPETKAEFLNHLEACGIGMMSYSDSIVPLDKKLYSLRDVTATVSNIPLIASSIMSKKLAIDTDAIILDVKVGDGAFMRTMEDAEQLAQTMITIGKQFNRKIAVMITEMSQPLGMAVGNSLEVIEAITTIKGGVASDFSELLIEIVSVALFLKGDVANIEDGKPLVQNALASGISVPFMKEFIKAYGGDPNVVDDTSTLPVAKHVYHIHATRDAYIHGIKADYIGKASMVLGAGRAKKEDSIDYAAGAILYKKVGDAVHSGEIICSLYYNNESQISSALELINQAYTYGTDPIEKPSIVKKVII